jgi:hypothetical protein
MYLRQILGDGLSALRATLRQNRNFAEALWTFLGAGVGRSRLFVHAGDEGIDRRDYEEVNGSSDQQERDQRVDEVADGKNRLSNSEAYAGKIWLAHKHRNQRRQKVFGKRADNSSESGADHDADSHVHYVAAKDELLETF